MDSRITITCPSTDFSRLTPGVPLSFFAFSRTNTLYPPVCERWCVLAVFTHQPDVGIYTVKERADGRNLPTALISSNLYSTGRIKSTVEIAKEVSASKNAIPGFTTHSASPPFVCRITLEKAGAYQMVCGRVLTLTSKFDRHYGYVPCSTHNSHHLVGITQGYSQAGD